MIAGVCEQAAIEARIKWPLCEPRLWPAILNFATQIKQADFMSQESPQVFFVLRPDALEQDLGRASRRLGHVNGGSKVRVQILVVMNVAEEQYRDLREPLTKIVLVSVVQDTPGDRRIVSALVIAEFLPLRYNARMSWSKRYASAKEATCWHETSQQGRRAGSEQQGGRDRRGAN